MKHSRLKARLHARLSFARKWPTIMGVCLLSTHCGLPNPTQQMHNVQTSDLHSTEIHDHQAPNLSCSNVNVHLIAVDPPASSPTHSKNVRDARPEVLNEFFDLLEGYPHVSMSPVHTSHGANGNGGNGGGDDDDTGEILIFTNHYGKRKFQFDRSIPTFTRLTFEITLGAFEKMLRTQSADGDDDDDDDEHVVGALDMIFTSFPHGANIIITPKVTDILLEKLHNPLIHHDDQASVITEHDTRLESVLSTSPCGLAIIDRIEKDLYAHITHLRTDLNRALVHLTTSPMYQDADSFLRQSMLMDYYAERYPLGNTFLLNVH